MHRFQDRLSSTLSRMLLAGFALFHVNVMAQQEGEPPRREIVLPAGAFTRGAPLPAWVRGDIDIPPNRPSEPAMMRLADSQIRVGEGAFLRRVLSANDSASLAALGQYEIAFMPEYQRVELHALRILRGKEAIDQLAAATIRFMQTERDAGNAVFSGSVSAALILNDLRPGDSVDLSYTVYGDNPVYGGRYFDSGSWEAGVPVGRRRFVVDLPAGRSVNYRFLSAEAATPQVEPRLRADGQRRQLVFEGENLAAAENEQNVPPDVHVQRWLQLSEFSSWGQVTEWALDLFKPQPLDAALKSVLTDVAKGRTAEERVMRALAFVQNEIRYVSIALGENSHRPAAPSEVLSRRYGDCKDKSMLLVTLLRQAGVEAYPVLLSTTYRRNADAFLPSPHVFNHAIVKLVVGGRAYFVDPTLSQQFGSLDVIGDAHPQTQVLVVRPGNDKLETTPLPREALYTMLRQENVKLDAFNGTAEMTLTTRFAGLDAERFRQALSSMTAEQLRKYYQGLLDRRYNRAELVGEPKFDDDRQLNRVTATARYRIPDFAEGQDADWSFRYQGSNLLEQFFVPNSARRRLPLVLPTYPYVGQYEFTLTLPETVDANRRPYEKTLVGEGFTMSQRLSLRGREARAVMTLSITADRVQGPRVANFMSDLRGLNPMLGGSFTVDRQDMKAAAAPTVPFKQATLQQVAEQVRRSSGEIEAARKQGASPADALCDRALAYVRQGQTREALADVQALEASGAKAADNLQCAGFVQFMSGDPVAAQASLARVVGLGRQTYDVYLVRGLGLLYGGRAADAASDFAQAYKLAPTANARARADYWRMLALLRSGQKPTPLQVHSAWPAGAIALLEGRQTPEQLIQTVMADTPAESLEPTLAEAYFFISQYHGLSGRSLQSRGWLRQSLDKGALFNLSHYAAQREFMQ